MKGEKLGFIIMLLAAAAFALSGCGSDGDTGATGATGATGPAGPQGPAGSAAGTDASKMTEAEVGTLLGSSTATVDSVTIASKPVVSFTVKDAKGNGITGLAQYTTSTPPGLKYIRFNIAKLVPSTNGSPSKWVNYIVTTAATPPVATPPTTDSQGTLVDNGGGRYTYTFYRDLDKIKDTAGVEDVTYEPLLSHRLILTLTHRDAPEPFPNSQNIVFDFTIDPATKAAIPLTATSTRREITSTAACNSCHNDIAKMFSDRKVNDGGHFDTRPDVRNCISCHTDQQRITATSVNSVNGVFPLPAPGTPRRNTPRIGDGEVMLDFAIMIHKMHMGRNLTKTQYSFDGILFNEKGYPQDVINCRKCHNDDVTGSTTGAQGGNWKTKPSRMACGACHDNVNFATGGSYTTGGTGHGPGGVGGAWNNDAVCTVCHTPDYIETKHMGINGTPNNPKIAAGLVNFTYEISSVTVNASNQPVVQFRIMKTVPPSTTATPVVFDITGSTSNALSGFTGAPSFLVAWALPQDGIVSPADFNNKALAPPNATLGAQPVSISIARLVDLGITATTTTGSYGSMTGPDANGYYTATLNGTATGILKSVWGATSTTPAVTATDTVQGVSAWPATAPAGTIIGGADSVAATPANPARFPVGAQMRTVALQGYFTQAAGTGGIAAATARHAVMVTKTVTGDTVRRSVVDSAKCAKCHEYFEGHGGNRNYNMDGCTVCHIPNLSSSGRIINDPNTPEASQNLKDMIHGIHAGPFRKNGFIHTRSKSGLNTIYDWSKVEYPNHLDNCLSCHKADTYGTVPGSALATVDITPTDGTAAPNGVFSARNRLPNATDIIISPYSAACVSCHDSDAAKAHMTTNGGKVSVTRAAGAGYATSEGCAVCHGIGRSEGVDKVHAR